MVINDNARSQEQEKQLKLYMGGNWMKFKARSFVYISLFIYRRANSHKILHVGLLIQMSA